MLAKISGVMKTCREFDRSDNVSKRPAKEQRRSKSAGNKSHMKREAMESQPRKRTEERQKLEVKENYWSGYQRLRIRICVQKKSYPTPVAGK
jgi:hypothetical protein